MTETPKSMGAYLRAARRRRRISIDRAAEDTRIRSDYLMRMESDEFDFLAPAYVRGFLKTYARFLRVDADPLLDEFDQKHGAGFDTARIIALERRQNKEVPKERRRISSWTIAALVAGTALILLAVVGLIVGPEENEPAQQVAETRDDDRNRRREPKPTPTPTPTPTVIVSPVVTPTSAAVATTGGITLEVVAAEDRCWVDVTSDGTNVYSGILELGDSETFTAEEDMDVVLGYPEGVELVVNGQNIGSPGGVDPVTINLPEDIDTL